MLLEFFLGRFIRTKRVVDAAEWGNFCIRSKIQGIIEAFLALAIKLIVVRFTLAEGWITCATTAITTLEIKLGRAEVVW